MDENVHRTVDFSCIHEAKGYMHYPFVTFLLVRKYKAYFYELNGTTKHWMRIDDEDDYQCCTNAPPSTPI